MPFIRGVTTSIRSRAKRWKRRGLQRRAVRVGAGGGQRLADSADAQGDQAGKTTMSLAAAHLKRARADPSSRIEAAELVPSHSGRAQRRFVARVHREGAGAPGVRAFGRRVRLGWPGEYPSSGYARV